jgi:hypothetical protein
MFHRNKGTWWAQLESDCWEIRCQITNMLSIKHSIILIISVSVKFLLESVLFINNNCPFLYLCWPFFFMKHSWTNSFNLQYIEWGSCLTGREVLMLLHEESSLDCLYCDKSLDCFWNPHLIHTSHSVTVTMKLYFDYW